MAKTTKTSTKRIVDHVAPETHAPAPLLVSVPEAARLLGISRERMWDSIYRGEIRSLKIGWRRLIAMSELQAFIERSMEAAAS